MVSLLLSTLIDCHIPSSENHILLLHFMTLCIIFHVFHHSTLNNFSCHPYYHLLYTSLFLCKPCLISFVYLSSSLIPGPFMRTFSTGWPWQKHFLSPYSSTLPVQSMASQPTFYPIFIYFIDPFYCWSPCDTLPHSSSHTFSS